MMAPLTLEVVREAARLEQAAQEWTRFAATTPATPFQLPPWQLAWWRHFGTGPLHAMLFRSLDTLVGVMPCYVDESGGRRSLQLIGSGMAGLLEPPFEPRLRGEATRLLKGHLLANPAWDVCDWRGLALNSPLGGLALGEGFEVKTAADGEWGQAPLRGTFEEFWDARPFSLRRNFLKYLDPAGVPNRPRFEVVTQADPEFVNTLIRSESGPGGAFAGAKDGPAAFLAELARVLDEADMLRLFGLRAHGRLAAVILAIDYRNTLYAFAGGHDAEFGRLLLFESLRYAFAQRYDAWNFGGGNEAYKALWGAQMTATARIAIERKKIAS